MASLSNDIPHLIFHDIELHKFRYCIFSCRCFDLCIFRNSGNREYAGGVQWFLKPLLSQRIIVCANWDLVDPANIIQHGQQIKTFRIPFALIIPMNVIWLQNFDYEVDIAKFFETMAYIALEQFKAASLLNMRFQQFFHWHLQNFCQLINCFSRAFFQTRFPAANIVDRCIGQVANLGEPIHGQPLLWHQFLNLHCNHLIFTLSISVNRDNVNWK